MLFAAFFKAGTFTFAGGLAMLPIIQRDLVDRHALLSAEDFLEYATLAQTLPGVISLNCALFVGRRAAGWSGMFAAGIGAVISAFALMVAATIAIQRIPQDGPALGAMRCIRAASAALILSAAVTLGAHNLKTGFAVAVTVGAFALVLILGVSTPLVVLLAGVAGVARWWLSRDASGKGGAS